MKLTQENKPVQRSSSFQETGFRVAANAQAFEILSSKLYTDVQTAIIRELSTNAADAHRMAGREDKPFDVHLPNSMEPYFSIRDYGVSLTEDDVINVYTVYFESLNRQSEDTTGGFGLGSKSPFAYTDMFAVTVFKDGVKRTYSAFKENGEPRIARLTEETTDEADGVEVRMDTRPGDDWDFRQKAEKVYRFFDVRPNITGQRVEIPDPTPTMTGDGWELYKGDAAAAGKISVVMGNVCYRANRSKITHKLGNEGELVIYVPVGKCQPAVSREELQYDDATVAYLQGRVNAAQEAAIKQIQDSLGHCETLIDKLIALRQYSSLLTIPVVEKSLPTIRKDAWTLRRLEIRGGDKLSIGFDRFNSSLKPNAHTRYVFVECDVDDPTSIRQKLRNNLRHWMKQQQSADRAANRHSAIFYLASIEDAKRKVFCKMFGTPSVKLTEIPDAPRNHRGGGGGGSRTFVKQMTRGYAARMSDKWNSVDADDIDTAQAVAVPRQGYKVVWNGIEQDPGYVQEVAQALGYTKVYGLPQNRYDKLREELDLVDLEERARVAMEAFVKGADELTRATYHHKQYNSYDGKFLKRIKGVSKEADDMLTFLAAEAPPSIFKQLISQFGLTMPDADDPLDAFRKKYPLITNIDFYYANLDDVLEYIQLKEKN